MAIVEKETHPVKDMVEALKKWQAIERKSIEQAAAITETTENPVIRMIMDIIRQDSIMHHRVQQFIIQSMTDEAVRLSPEEVGEIWSRIEEHDDMERSAVQTAKRLKEKAWSPIQKQLLEYLLTDEAKHEKLLEQLGEIKKGMYPYGS